jgi:hypothetical protein
MYFLVKRAHGASWDPTRPRREQQGWDDHAAFMDRLVEDGFIILGGPVGEGDGDYALLVVEAKSEGHVGAKLADDPWGEDMLATESIEPWTIFLRRAPG